MILCICIFVSVSNIYATDVNNHDAIDIDGMDCENSEEHISIEHDCDVDDCGIKLTVDEFCCCKHGHCNHNLNTDTHHHDDEITCEDIINNNLDYSYTCYIKTTNSRWVTISTSSKEEALYQRNSNFRNVLTLDDYLDLGQNSDNIFKNYNYLSANDLSVNYTVSDLNYIDLEITLNSDELYIKDYNLEYYIFTNPYIIIQEPNINLNDMGRSPVNNTLIFNNHYSKFNPKLTIDHNIETDFNQEFFTCNILDNYESITNSEKLTAILSGNDIIAYLFLIWRNE